jgi:hypothetical protein
MGATQQKGSPKQLRGRSLGTKLSEAEYAQCEKSAARRGQTLSEWHRERHCSLSAVRVAASHANEFTSAEQSYCTQGNQIRGGWQGKLAQEWVLTGDVSAEQFMRLALGVASLHRKRNRWHRPPAPQGSARPVTRVCACGSKTCKRLFYRWLGCRESALPWLWRARIATPPCHADSGRSASALRTDIGGECYF